MRFAAPLLSAALLAPAALAQVVISPADPAITTEQTCVFSAGAATAAPLVWEYRVVEPGGGSITVNEHGQGVYVPPAFVFGTETYRIRANPVSDPSAVAETTVRVSNGTLMGKIMPSFMASVFKPRMEILAGDGQATGFADGSGGAARFNFPEGMVHVPSHPDQRIQGRWLVADSRNNRIRVVDPGTGEVWTWLGGPKQGHADGKGQDARFHWPCGLAVDGGGDRPWRLFIADFHNAVIRSVDAEGNVTTLAGTPNDYGFKDGPAAKALFVSPRGLAVDREGAVYVSDVNNHVIRRIFQGEVSTYAGKRWPAATGPGEQVDGARDKATLVSPRGLALDELTGDLYVTAQNAVRRVDRQGGVTTVAGSFRKAGWEDGPGGTGPLRCAHFPCFNQPLGLSMSRGQLFIVDLGNAAIRRWDPATGDLATLTSRAEGGPLPIDLSRPGRLVPDSLCDLDEALLGCPSSIAFDDQGGCLVSMRSCLGELALDRRGRLADPRPVAGSDAGDEKKGEAQPERKSDASAPAKAGGGPVKDPAGLD